MRTKLELPNVEEVSHELRGEIYRAATRAVRLATRQLEQDLEAQLRGAAGGNAWKAWKSVTYPSGDTPAKDPTGIVFGNGGRKGIRTQGMLSYWSLPGTNRAKSGGWLAIPTRAAGSTGRSRDLTPAQWERRTGIKLSYFAPPNARGRYALLLSDGTLAKNNSGALRAYTKRRAAQGREKMRVPIFILIPEQPHANRVSIGSAIERATRRMVEEYAKGLVKLT